VISQFPTLSGALEVVQPGLYSRAVQEQAELTANPQKPLSYIQNFPTTSTPPPNAPPFHQNPHLAAFYQDVKPLSDAAGIEWENNVTLQSVYNNVRQEWRAYIGRVAPRPSMFVAGVGEQFVDIGVQREALERAGEPKEWAVVDPFGVEKYITGEGTVKQ
jgi:hypothetical protein